MATILSIEELSKVTGCIKPYLDLFGVEWIQEDAMSIFSRVWYTTLDTDIYSIQLDCVGILLTVKFPTGKTTSQADWVHCNSSNVCSVNACIGKTLTNAVLESKYFTDLTYLELERKAGGTNLDVYLLELLAKKMVDAGLL
jgi:hypothetical protein